VRSVVRISKRRKPRDVKEQELTRVVPEGDARSRRLWAIQALLPVALEEFVKEMQREMEELTGPRYERTGGQDGLVRWGRQPGSIFLLDQKVPVEVPRVRDHRRGVEVPLETYRGMQTPQAADRLVFQRLLGGLSCRDYRDASSLDPESFGLSASTVSRRFIQVTASKLRSLQDRSLAGEEYVALFLDGKAFAGETIVLAVGVLSNGEKRILGFVQTTTENETSCSEFLQGLVERGLRYEDGLLCVIDGGKGLRKAITRVFGRKAAVQRCQLHKRTNVCSYLPKSQQAAMRKRLKRAMDIPSYADSKAALLRIARELEKVNVSAARSLLEGLEEILTLQRLGLADELGRSFKTTNVIESVNAGVGQRTDKVDRWRNSNQIQRWVAAAALEVESRLRKVCGYRHLAKLQAVLQTIDQAKAA
jgi:transposase-like protein